MKLQEIVPPKKSGNKLTLQLLFTEVLHSAPLAGTKLESENHTFKANSYGSHDNKGGSPPWKRNKKKTSCHIWNQTAQNSLKFPAPKFSLGRLQYHKLEGQLTTH